jgi:vacuolar-type H+-ATPase subunit H
MDVLLLIDKLDGLVHNAHVVPLTDQLRVDKEEIHEILDEMRATISEEMKQARWIVKEREEMLTETKDEADRIVKEAREWHERLLAQVTKAAGRTAEDIIENARANERQARLGAEDYADKILHTLEVELSNFVAALERLRHRLARSGEHATIS